MHCKTDNGFDKTSVVKTETFVVKDKGFETVATDSEGKKTVCKTDTKKMIEALGD